MPLKGASRFKVPESDDRASPFIILRDAAYLPLEFALSLKFCRASLLGLIIINYMALIDIYIVLPLNNHLHGILFGFSSSDLFLF